jgi:protein-S-isoprenylcysteine O-methyltransferase Ste14
VIEHVHQALAQVRTMHRYVVEKQRFKGYSGRARALSGVVALGASYCLARHPGRGSDLSMATWFVVAGLGAAINYGAVLYWYLSEPAGDKQALRLKPVIEVLPGLAAGAVLTAAFWRDGAFDYMVPVWMLLFGLANLASRHVLPREIAWVGLFYMTAGAVLLYFQPRTGLSNPWPMGIVFFCGECMGGLVIFFDRPDRPGLASFLGFGPGSRTP